MKNTNATPVESWRLISGTKMYQVSNLGNVRSVRIARKAVAAGKQPRNMVPYKNGGGYLRIKIDTDAKLNTNVGINRAVAFAFLGTPEEGNYMVNHKNMNKLDNRVENLEWVSPKQNARHAQENGTRRSKFTDEAIHTMRNMREMTAISISGLARLYNVNVTTMANIVKRVSYASVK